MPDCSADNIRHAAGNFLAVEEGYRDSMANETLSGLVSRLKKFYLYIIINSTPGESSFLFSTFLLVLNAPAFLNYDVNDGKELANEVKNLFFSSII